MKTYLDMDGILRHCRRCFEEEYDEFYLVSAVPEEVIRSLSAADVVEVVYCHDCVHRPEAAPGVMSGVGVEAPRDEEGWSDDTCPYLCADPLYNIMPHDEWFCHHGERKDNG